MAQKEATRTCEQCHKDVAEVNFALHEMHCRRFLCLCPDCEDTVPREQLSQHRKEQHTQVRCSACHKKMERCHLLDHELEECVERMQTCNFCDLDLPWKELNEHSVACGSRTERCKDCGRYVKLSEQRDHALICCSSDDDSKPPQTKTSSEEGSARQFEPVKESNSRGDIEQKPKLDWLSARTWDDDQEEEEEEDDDEAHALHSAYMALRSIKARQNHWDDQRDPDKISICPFCHLALPLRTLSWHQAKCKIHIHMKFRDRGQKEQNAAESSSD